MTSHFDDLAHSQIICNNRINELQYVEISASRSQQVDITPRLQRVLFNDLPTPVTGSGHHRSIQANDLRAPIASSGQQHQNHVNESSAPIIDSGQQRPGNITNFLQITNKETQHRDDDIEEIRAQLQNMNSKVHQATSTAPEIDRVLRETQNTPFTTRLLKPDEYNKPRQHYDKAYRDGKNRKASNYQISDQPSNRSTGNTATIGSHHLKTSKTTKHQNEGERFRQVKEERDRQHGQKRPSEQTNADTEAHKRTRDDRNNEQKREKTPPPRHVINVIMGGLQTCKDSVRSIKEYKRKTSTSQKWV
ncbi:hypothetical protein DY000_02013926 [Brassica cretica]|uniref:Uncharacterized protein n=1 Tax=Brassica cretica TaxID=69181 RepID=A0ABQ7D9W2_BRACR|nr:hypothetical protein DY000_02013926 [Brassica cretica]